MTMVNDMIETLAAAKVAMEENPQLKRQIQDRERELMDMKSAHSELSFVHCELATDREYLYSQVKALEASLEAARFREQATSQKLDKLVSSFRETIDEVSPAPIPVAAEAVPELVVQSAEMGVVEAASEMLTQPNPFNPFDEDGNTAGEAPQTDQLMEHAAGRNWVEPDPTMDTEFSQGQAPAINQCPAGEEDLPETNEAWNQPERTAMAEDTPSEIDVPQVETGGILVGSGEHNPWNAPKIKEQPYSGKPHSFKPASITWAEWIDGGGARPWWLTETELNKLREGSALAS